MSCTNRGEVLSVMSSPELHVCFFSTSPVWKDKNRSVTAVVRGALAVKPWSASLVLLRVTPLSRLTVVGQQLFVCCLFYMQVVLSGAFIEKWAMSVGLKSKDLYLPLSFSTAVSFMSPNVQTSLLVSWLQSQFSRAAVACMTEVD